MTRQKDPSPRSVLSYLLHVLRGWPIPALLLAIALMAVASALTAMPATLLGRGLDQIIESDRDTFSRVRWTLAVIAACIVGREAADWVRRCIVELIAARVERTEFVELVRHLLRIDLSLLHQERVGALNVRVNRSVSGVVQLIRLVFNRLLPTTMTAAAAVALAAPRHHFVALIMILVVLVATLVTFVQMLSQKGIRLSIFHSREDMGAKVTELLWGLDYVRAQGVQEIEIAQTDRIAERLRSRTFQHHRWMISFETVKRLAEGAGFLAILTTGMWLATNGLVTKGDVLAFSILYGSVTHPVRELHMVLDEAFECAMRTKELIDLRGLPIDPGLRGTLPPEADREPIVEARSFGVEQSTESGTHCTLRAIDFSIRRGEVIGIAGPSGAGKSTLLGSILGLVSQYNGSLKVFGHEVRDLDKAELSKLVAYVPQTPFVLMGTLRDNLCYTTRKDATDRELMQTLAKAQLLDLVSRSPAGLDAMLAEQGRTLSGGEKQRLMLARIFLNPGRLLVLDEATSALDSDNEALIQQALSELTAGSVATFIVAHRLSTLSIADRILVIDNGTVVQEGSFELLSTSPGLFRDLLSRQGGRAKPVPQAASRLAQDPTAA